MKFCAPTNIYSNNQADNPEFKNLSVEDKGIDLYPSCTFSEVRAIS